MNAFFTKKVPLYFETKESLLILGDSFKILTKMEPESVDMPCKAIWKYSEDKIEIVIKER